MGSDKERGFAVILWIIILVIISFVCALLLIFITILGIDVLSGEAYSEVRSVFLWLSIDMFPRILYPVHFMLFVLSFRKIMSGLYTKLWFLAYIAIVMWIFFNVIGLPLPYAITYSLFSLFAFLSILVPQLIILNISIKRVDGVQHTKKMLLLAFFVPVIGSVYYMRKQAAFSKEIS